MNLIFFNFPSNGRWLTAAHCPTATPRRLNASARTPWSATSTRTACNRKKDRSIPKNCIVLYKTICSLLSTSFNKLDPNVQKKHCPWLPSTNTKTFVQNEIRIWLVFREWSIKAVTFFARQYLSTISKSWIVLYCLWLSSTSTKSNCLESV